MRNNALNIVLIIFTGFCYLSEIRQKFKKYENLIGFDLRLCSHLVPEYGARVRLSLSTNANAPFYQVSTSEFGHVVSLPKYKIKTSFSGTEVGTGSLCARVYIVPDAQVLVLGH